MNDLIKKENFIAQVEVNPKLPETPSPSIPVPDAGIYALICFVISMCVFYKLLMK